MNVAIFETEHFEACYPVIRFFDTTENEITVFTYGPAYEQFKYLFRHEPSRYAWIVKPARTSKYRFIIDMYKWIRDKNISLVYLNTVSNNFILYYILIFFLRRVRVIVTIHNINTQFEYKPSISPRRLIRYIGRRSLMSIVREFNVIAMPMVGSLAARLSKNKKVYCVPGAVFEETLIRQQQPPVTELINIVIPGSVDVRRRNYVQAFELIRALETLRLNSTVTFLGSVQREHGAAVSERAKSFQGEYVRLKYFGLDTIAQPIFERYMNEATLIFIPSTLTPVIEDGIKETYGTTMSSGNLFDVVKHAKPFIIPSQLPIDRFLEKSCLRYNTVDEIAAFIISMRANPAQYETMLLDAMDASRNYTVQKARERNPGLSGIIANVRG